MSEQNFKRRGSLVWPLVLVGLGVFFLLSNMGIIEADIWPSVLRLWPLLLVAIGLDLLLGRRSGIWAGITVVIVLAMFAAGFWLVDTTAGAWNGDLVVHQISQDLSDAESSEVLIHMGVGVLEVEGFSSDTLLISGEIELAEDEDLHEDYEVKRDTVFYELDTRGQEYYPSWFINNGWEGDKDWELALNDDIPMDLTIDTGVGVSVIDVSELALTYLRVDSGVGETTVYLPATGQYTVSIDAGVGEITVYIPADLEVRMQLDTGLGETKILGSYYNRNGYYYSEGFDTAEHYVEISIDGGVGEITVIQQD
ncbi:MAG: DUF5668 domain-containing protein [Chloroflexota bacterium]